MEQDGAFGAAHARVYAEGAFRQVPGLDGLHRMTSQLLAERVPARGRVLLLGAGGGLEIKALADAHPGWSFDGVDPSADMLARAREVAEAHAARVRLHHGYAEAAPEGPFDGAASLLTFHFIGKGQRLATLRELRRRLAPGAPLVVAHLSFPQEEPARSAWMGRHIAFGGGDPSPEGAPATAMRERLTVLSPAEDEAMLREAGFADVGLFYAGLALRGWVGYAA